MPSPSERLVIQTLSAIGLQLHRDYGTTESLKIVSKQLFDIAYREQEALRSYHEDGAIIYKDEDGMYRFMGGALVTLTSYGPGPDIHLLQE